MDFMFGLTFTDQEIEVLKTCLIESLDDPTALDIYVRLCGIYCSEDDAVILEEHGIKVEYGE